MPNFKTHAVAGTVVGISVSLYEYYEIKKVDPNAQFDLSKLAFNSLAATAGAIIPDKLEPAYHPNHRSFFHNSRIAKGEWLVVLKPQDVFVLLKLVSIYPHEWA